MEKVFLDQVTGGLLVEETGAMDVDVGEEHVEGLVDGHPLLHINKNIGLFLARLVTHIIIIFTNIISLAPKPGLSPML